MPLTPVWDVYKVIPWHLPPLAWSVHGTVSIRYKYIVEAFHAPQRQTKSLKETSVSMILRSLAVGGCSPESLLCCCVYIMCFNIATARGCRIMYLPRIIARFGLFSNVGRFMIIQKPQKIFFSTFVSINRDPGSNIEPTVHR